MTIEHVAPQDSTLRNSEKLTEKPAKALELYEEVFCYWNDKKYSGGGAVCDSHRRYECWNGKWIEVGPC